MVAVMRLPVGPDPGILPGSGSRSLQQRHVHAGADDCGAECRHDPAELVGLERTPQEQGVEAVGGDADLRERRRPRPRGGHPCAQSEGPGRGRGQAEGMGHDRHEDDRDGDRVEEGDDRHRDREHRRQARGRQYERDEREEDHPRPVGDRGQQAVKELRRGGDESHRGRHTGGEHDETEDDVTRPAHRRARRIGQEARAVRVTLRVGDDVSDQAQADVDHGQECASDECRGGGAPNDLGADAAARVPQRRHDDDAEGQGRDGIHRHVAFQQAGGQWVVDVLARGRVVRGWQGCQAEEHEEDEQAKEDRRQHLAEAVDNVGGIPTQVKGDGEEDQVEDDRCNGGVCADDGCDGRRKGDGPRARKRVEGADGEVDQHREDEAEESACAADEVADIGAGQGNRDDRNDGESDTADEETDHRGGHIGACRRSHDRRENKVTGPKEHGEERQ